MRGKEVAKVRFLSEGFSLLFDSLVACHKERKIGKAQRVKNKTDKGNTNVKSFMIISTQVAPCAQRKNVLLISGCPKHILILSIPKKKKARFYFSHLK